MAAKAGRFLVVVKVPELREERGRVQPVGMRVQVLGPEPRVRVLAPVEPGLEPGRAKEKVPARVVARL